MEDPRPVGHAAGMEPPRLPPDAVAVAVDGSDGAARATAWAVEHARTARLPLVLVHAAPAADAYGGAVWTERPEAGHVLSREDEAALGAEATQVLDAAESAVRSADGELPVVRAPMLGDPRVALLDVARHVGLVVLGSRGRGPVRSLLLGSVSASVARHAACPVAVVRDHDADPTVRRVVVGVDGSEGSRQTLRYAYGFASLRRAPLLVVHCYWDVVAAVNRSLDRSISDEEVADLGVVVAELVAGLAEDFPDVDAHVILRQGLVDTVLTNEAMPGDVIVVGHRTHRSPQQFLYGSVAIAVLERAESTVLVVPLDTAPS